MRAGDLTGKRGADGEQLTEAVVDCHDSGALAAFWAAALGYHVVLAEAGQVEIAAWQ